jgi:hypothetical protein
MKVQCSTGITIYLDARKRGHQDCLAEINDESTGFPQPWE